MEQGLEEYSEELVYTDKVPRSKNDASLDQVENLSRANIEIFKLFKENTRNGMLPCLIPKYDPIQGFIVEALCDIPPRTLLVEYTGVVTRVSDSGLSDSDSLMMLLETGNPKTSLIIDPSKKGNLARFLSGVNNSSHESRKKINVRTRRFAVDGECRVVLFSSRKIVAGERLSYDYNAGLVEKSMDEEDWANHGFYDTSHFN
jgi:hypothetical protein